MESLAIVGTALRSLRRAPLRSALTSLGVIVGVTAVIATASIGNGAKKEIQATLEKPESRTIHLIAVPQVLVPGRANELPRADQLRVDDYEEIRDSADHIVAASPRIYLQNVTAKAHGHSESVIVEGIDVGGFRTVPRKLIAGTLFSGVDVGKAANVCVISESLSKRIFEEGYPIGHPIQINDTSFIVLGVVDDLERYNAAMLRTIDLRVYAPFTSALRRLDPTAQITISVQASNVDQVGEVQRRLNDIIEQRRSGRKAAFRTSTAFESIKTRADGSLAVTRLLAVVGGIALVVGGIGIMNIMLVSVTERTREIGIRMAIGTRGRNVLAQFLAESVILSVLGGGVGILVGWTMSSFITRLNGWPTEIDVGAVAVALLCSAGVGVFFGYYPAAKAASLNPVEALRAE